MKNIQRSTFFKMSLLTLLGVGVNLCSVAAWAMPEAELKGSYSTISSWYDTTVKPDSMTSVDGVSLHYVSIQKPQAQCVVILSQGSGDFSKEYAELMYDIDSMGCDYFALDHRGQGDSGRLLKDPQKIYVRHFDDYVSDFSSFVANVVHPEKYQKSLLIGESMGGGIATGFLELHPKMVQQVILLAPMLKIDTSPVGEAAAETEAWLAIRTGFGTSYAYGETAYVDQEAFSKNTLTSSPERYQNLSDEMHLHTEWQKGGATNLWLYEAIKFTRRVRQIPNLFQVPTLIYQAGLDHWVMPEGESQACGLSPAYCRLRMLPTSQHQMIIERDEIRQPVIEQIKQSLR